MRNTSQHLDQSPEERTPTAQAGNATSSIVTEATRRFPATQRSARTASSAIAPAETIQPNALNGLKCRATAIAPGSTAATATVTKNKSRSVNRRGQFVDFGSAPRLSSQR